MAILIGIWDAILVLVSTVLLTILALWSYWRQRIAALNKEIASLDQKTVQLQTEKGEMASLINHQAGKALRLTNDNLYRIKSELDSQSGAEAQKWCQLLTDSLKVIENHEWRLNRLYQNMDFVSRLEAPDHSLRFSTVKLDVIVNDIVDEFQDSALVKGIRLAWWAKPERFPRIMANEIHLRQVFINLIDNAIKYCGEKDEIDVALEASGEKQVIHARVSDTGSGIPEEDLELVFDKGYTVEGARGRKPKEGSHGLGLYIAKLIVEKHRGTIDVTSKLGKGTTFSITLPIQRI